MKINWGGGIAIAIIIFTLITFSFVYFAFNQDVNLVREDYYEAEVQFDEKLETIKRTDSLAEQLKIGLVTGGIEIVFPKNFEAEKISGTIFLYRPSDRGMDIKLPIELDSLKTQLISTSEMQQGLWKVKVEWNVDTTSYFNDKAIVVQ